MIKVTLECESEYDAMTAVNCFKFKSAMNAARKELETVKLLVARDQDVYNRIAIILKRHE